MCIRDRRRGSQGQAVLGVQTYLNVISRKYASVTPLTRDGNFDSRTEISVRAFQRQFKLTITVVSYTHLDVYKRQELPDAVKWGPEKWDVDYRDINRINCYDAGTAPCRCV